MIFTLAAKNLTSIPSTTFGPQAGKRWRILSARIVLNSSSTAGTRTVTIDAIGGETGIGLTLASISSTSTSATLSGGGGWSTAGPNTGEAWTYPPCLNAFEYIEFLGTLISGDTFGWELQVEEEDA